MTGLTSVEQFEPGARLGAYRLERLIGIGGFAQVWLALEEGPHGFAKRVALKIIGGRKKAIASLINEARVGGQLRHPNIVDIYRIAEEGDVWYVAMEYVEGGDLAGLLLRVREAGLLFPPSVVTEVGLRIARALHYAHNARDHGGQPLDLVHRDLKPANVLVSREGEVKVTDFGIAKAAVSLDTTGAGQLKGTPCYMAPEVLGGERVFRPRVDLFALGAMLWEMTTGDRLFGVGSAVSMAAHVMFGDAHRDAGRVEPLFPELVPLLRSLLQRAPERRTQSAGEVVDELRAIADRLDAPGDLALYLRLLDIGVLPRTSRSDRAGTLTLPETGDRSWSRLFQLVRGEQIAMQDTISWEADTGGAEQVPGRVPPAEALPHDPSGLGAALVPTEVPEIEDTVSISALRGVTELPGATAPSAAGAPRSPAAPKQRRRRLAGLALALVLVGGAAVGLQSTDRAPPEVAVAGEPASIAAARVAPVEAAVEPETPPPSSPEPGPADAEQPPEPRPAATPALAEATPDRQPEQAPRPAPTPTAEPPTSAPAPPEPDPTVIPAVTPVVSGDDRACLVFRSTPPGVPVSLDGVSTGLLSRSGDRSRRSVSEGRVTVQMLHPGGSADAVVEARGGTRYVVHCSLVEPVGCSVLEATGGCR